MSESIVLMTEAEARDRVRQIKSHLHQARQLLLELYEREGWRALGYDSFAQCLEEEFSKSRSYLYRELATARLESGLGREVGEMPESHARAVLEVVGDDEDAARLAVYKIEAQHGETPWGLRGEGLTAKDYARAAKEVWVERNANGTTLLKRMLEGDVSVNDAYRIGRLMEESDDDVTWVVLSFTTDPQLADDLLALQAKRPDMWQEIVSTGAIPYDGESVNLGDATYTQLRAWVTLDNAEARAQHVENNRAFYESRGELVDAIICATRELCLAIHNGDPKDVVLDLSSRTMDLIGELDQINTTQRSNHADT